MAKCGRKTKYTQEFIEKEAPELIKYAKETDTPFLGEFCMQRGYSSQRVADFRKKNAAFAEALQLAKDIQETKIVKLALAKKIDTTMAIFTLKNVADWRDGQYLEHSGSMPQQKVNIVVWDKKAKKKGKNADTKERIHRQNA